MENGPLILVVDDDQDLLRLLQRVLEKEGYRVVSASEGAAALKAVEEQPPDLIILDIMMPGMDGYQVLDAVRKILTVPVIMLTAKRETAAIRDALAAGADDFVKKPFSTVELLARVKAKLRRS